MEPEVTFVAVQDGHSWIGEVIDLQTHKRLARTAQKYSSQETAKSAATSMWRTLVAQMRAVFA